MKEVTHGKKYYDMHYWGFLLIHIACVSTKSLVKSLILANHQREMGDEFLFSLFPFSSQLTGHRVLKRLKYDLNCHGFAL